MRSSRLDPVNPDSGAEQSARLVHPMLVALPVAFFVIDVGDRVVAGKQAAAALFEISSTSTTGPATLVRMFGQAPVQDAPAHDAQARRGSPSPYWVPEAPLRSRSAPVLLPAPAG